MKRLLFAGLLASTVTLSYAVDVSCPQSFECSILQAPCAPSDPNTDWIMDMDNIQDAPGLNTFHIAYSLTSAENQVCFYQNTLYPQTQERAENLTQILQADLTAPNNKWVLYKQDQFGKTYSCTSESSQDCPFHVWTKGK